MRRFFILAIVALLGIVTPIGSLVSAQGTTDEAWQNVTLPEDGAPRAELEAFLGTPGAENDATLVSSLSAYEVAFTSNLAHVPEVANAEFMIVIVSAGEFVLHVYEETFVVDPSIPRNIEILDATEDLSGAVHETTYAPSGTFIPGSPGINCMSMCTVLPGTPVLLLAGDRIIAPAGHLCYYCLLNGDSGSLLIYPLLVGGSEFSWIASRIASGAPPPDQMRMAPAGAATTRATSGMMAWAWFNPAPNCRRGHG